MGEPTGGGGEVGGGGELRLLSTEVIEGEGEGTCVEATDSRAALVFQRRMNAAIASSAVLGGGAVGSGKREVRGVTESAPRVPGASKEGPGGTSPLSSSFPAPALGAGVLPAGFPVLGEGGLGSVRGASTAMPSTGCFFPDLRLRVLLCGFAALWALKKPGDELGALRVSRMKVNITSLILARGRCLETGTSFRALHTKWVWPLGMNSTQVIGASGRTC